MPGRQGLLLLLRLDRRDEAIAASRQGLHETRVVSAVAERRPDFREAVRQPSIHVDVRLSPDRAPELLFTDDLARTREQLPEDSGRLRLERDLTSVLAQQIRGRVEYERAESIGHVAFAILVDFVLDFRPLRENVWAASTSWVSSKVGW